MAANCILSINNVLYQTLTKSKFTLKPTIEIMTIGYLRVSTSKQLLKNQQDEISRYAQENNLKIDQWIMEVVSGKKSHNGRRLGRTISKVKKGDTLIVSEVSRLSRNLTDIMTIMGNCLKKGINIYTTKEALAIRKSEGKILGRPKGSSPKLQILLHNHSKIQTMIQNGSPASTIYRHFKVSKDTWYKYLRYIEDLPYFPPDNLSE